MNHSSRFGRSRPLRSCWYKGDEAEADKARIYKKIRAQKAARRAKRLAKLKKSGKAVKASAQVATPIEFKVVKHDPSVPRACRSKHRLPSVTPAEATVVICYNGPREYKGRKSVICGYGKGPKNDKDRRIAKKQARENRYRALKKWQAEVDCGLIKTDNLEVPKPLGR